MGQDPNTLQLILSFLGWIGIGCAALLVSAFVCWLFGGLSDIGAASIERPRQRHGRNRVPQRLVEDLKAMSHLTDAELEYELTSLRHKLWPEFGVESNTLPVYEAREIAGIPMWRIRQLLSLSRQDLETRADVNRWQEVHDQVTRRLHKVALAINARREALVIAQGDNHVPTFLNPAAATEEPVAIGSLHA